MNQDYPTLNGIAPSWADVVTTFSVLDGGTLDMIDYSDISWSDSVEIGEQRGASGGRVMKRTVGARKCEAKATLYRDGLRKLMRQLAEKATVRGSQYIVGLVGFDILIQHTPPGETDIYVVKIKGCRLSGRSHSMSEGSDADKVEITLNPIEIVEIIDGKEMVLL